MDVMAPPWLQSIYALSMMFPPGCRMGQVSVSLAPLWATSTLVKPSAVLCGHVVEQLAGLQHVPPTTDAALWLVPLSD
jgi:hypothetical protein